MSNFNEKIKEILAFSRGFEQYKKSKDSEIGELKLKIEQLSLATSKVESKANEAVEKVKASSFDVSVFDSARRTFGEQIGLLKSHIDKEILRIEKDKKEPSKPVNLSPLEKDIAAIKGKLELSVNQLASKANAKDLDKALKLFDNSESKLKNAEAVIKKQVEDLKKSVKSDIEALNKAVKSIESASKSKKDDGAIKSITKSLADLNAKVAKIKHYDDSVLKAELSKTGNKLIKLQNELDSINQAFGE